MNSVEKMDVLDLIIETLRDHEKTLDELTARLELCLGDGRVSSIATPRTLGEGPDYKQWR
jgi:hypothetical protein